MSDDAFDTIMRQLDTPLTIVTTTDGQERAGCLVGFHAQCGMEPEGLSVWLSKANHTRRVAAMATTFAVHFLTETDHELARLFGEHSGDDIDKFDRCSWHPDVDGVPVLDDCANVVVGHKIALLETTPDHVCLVLEPRHSTAGGPFVPLRLSDVTDLDPGHDADERPRPASTRAPGADG